MAEKKKFEGTVITDSGQQIKYYTYAVSTSQAHHNIKIQHNEAYGREPWVYVRIENIKEVK